MRGAVLAQDPGSDPCSLTIVAFTDLLVLPPSRFSARMHQAMMLPPGLQLAAHAHVLGERPEATAEDATRRQPVMHIGQKCLAGSLYTLNCRSYPLLTL